MPRVSATIDNFMGAADAAEARTAIGAVSPDGTGITDPDAFRVALEVEDENGNLPVDGFTLADNTANTLPAGVYSSDALGTIRRHDGVTIGGVPIAPVRYTGSRIIDVAGAGGSGLGSFVLLDTLKSAFLGTGANGDKIKVRGKTIFTVRPSAVPTPWPALIGFGLFDSATTVADNFWDFDDGGGTPVYQDIRDWMIEFELVASVWTLRATQTIATQQRSAAATGTPVTKVMDLSSLGADSPVPDVSGNILSVPLKLVIIDSGTPLTSGTVVVAWDMEVEVVQ
jgi:hypothetical protein